MADVDEIVNGLVQELRRGTLILSVLSQLHEPQYGYSLVQKLEEKGIAMEAGTLYPLLRRLEKQQLLESSWELGDARPRRYYFLSQTGKAVYDRMRDEWRGIVAGMDASLRTVFLLWPLRRLSVCLFWSSCFS
jgi:DNA-binding PadR family transcriptional regulator